VLLIQLLVVQAGCLPLVVVVVVVALGIEI
jgi:hypothetical protein